MKIILATDGSDAAECAGNLLAHVPHSERLELTILYMNNAIDFHGILVANEVIDECRELERKKGAESCLRIAKMFQGSNAQLESLVVEGHPGVTLVEQAAKRSADLIVLGAVGHSRLERLLLGSTSDFVATHANCSVLVVRPNMKDDLAKHRLKVCIAYDGSDASKHSIASFYGLGWVTPNHIDIVNVVPPPYVYSDIPIQIDTSKTKLAAEKVLANGFEICQANGASSIDQHVLESTYVGDSVVQFAEAHNSDLIVLGDTGRGLMGRFFLGSVSRYVLRHAKCSVWIGRKATNQS